MAGDTFSFTINRRSRSAFEDVGFVDVKQYSPNQSDDEHLKNIEQHGKYVGSEDAMRYETMIFEGRKP